MSGKSDKYPISLHINRANGKYLYSIYDQHNNSMSFEVAFQVPQTMRKEVIETYNLLVRCAAERKRGGAEASVTKVAMLSELDLAVDVGNRISQTLIPNQIIRAIQRLSPTSITLSTNDSDVPWELMRLDGVFAFESIAIGKCLRTAEPPARRHPYLSKSRLSVLLISDPTCDLVGAAHEFNILKAYFDNDIHFDCTSLSKENASLKNISSILMEKSFDVVHYAGHTDIDIYNPRNNNFFLSDESISSDYFANLFQGQFPSLFFLNSCSSAVISSPENWNLYLEGIAPAFVRQGNSVVIGALWPVLDEAATNIAIEFYSSIGKGVSVGHSLQKARTKNQATKCNDATWIGYSLVGDPELSPISDKSWMTRTRTDGFDVAKQLAANENQVGLIGLHPYLFLSERYDLSMLGVACECEATEGLVLSPGLKIDDIGQLKEIKIGYTPYTSLHALFLHMARSQGCDLNEFRAIPMEKNELITAFRRGALSAAFLWEPWITPLLSEGFSLVKLPNFNYDYHLSCLVSTKETITKNKIGIENFLSQYNICVNLVKNNQINYRQLLAIQFGLTKKEISSGIDNINYLIIDETANTLMGKKIKDYINREVDFFKHEGILQKSFSIEENFYSFESFSPTPELNTDKVTDLGVSIQDSLTNAALLVGRFQGYF